MFLVQLAHDVAAHVVKSAKGQITFVRHDCQAAISLQQADVGGSCSWTPFLSANCC